eukprot:6725949-Pyramimonas_sp.AAC.1
MVQRGVFGIDPPPALATFTHSQAMRRLARGPSDHLTWRRPAFYRVDPFAFALRTHRVELTSRRA